MGFSQFNKNKSNEVEEQISLPCEKTLPHICEQRVGPLATEKLKTFRLTRAITNHQSNASKWKATIEQMQKSRDNMEKSVSAKKVKAPKRTLIELQSRYKARQSVHQNND